MKGPLFISTEDSRRLADRATPLRPGGDAQQTEDSAMNPLRTVARGDGVWLRTLPAILPAAYMGLKMINSPRRRAQFYRAHRPRIDSS